MDYSVIALIAMLQDKPTGQIEKYSTGCLHRAAQQVAQCNPAAWFMALDILRDRKRKEIEDTFYAGYVETGVMPLRGGE